MAYNLPPPWDPGFCMPKNVTDEGLERRAFITKWQPRGSYDDPSVGTGGYAVPKYVVDEGYGQGTYTTKWQPSGSYAGPRVPNWLNRRPQLVSAKRLPGGETVATIAPMGDDELPAAYEGYGQRAAQALIQSVSRLPQNQRAQALRAITDRVDKSLWTRAQDIFRRFVKQGMAPAAAFPAALARAMGAGLAAEVVSTGIRGTAPQAKSLLGLGCYGCAAILALGADEASDCQTTPGYSWIYGTGNLPGHWQRTAAGAKDVPFCKTPPAGAVTVDPATTDVRTHAGVNTMAVGPFLFNPDRISKIGFNRARTPDLIYMSPDPAAQMETQPVGSPVHRITEDILKWLGDQLKDVMDDKAVRYTDKGQPYSYPEPDAAEWFGRMGITPDTPLQLHRLWHLRTAANSPETAFAATKNPANGEDLVMHIRLSPAWGSSSNKLVLKVWLNPIMDPGLFSINTLLAIPAAILNPLKDVIEEGLNKLGDLACDILNSPGGPAAGAAAAGAVGAPPQAGAVGANIAKNACGSKPPATTAVPAPSILPYVLIGGGALVALALLTRKNP